MAKILSVYEHWRCSCCKAPIARTRLDSPHLVRRRNRLYKRLKAEGYKLRAVRGITGRKCLYFLCPLCQQEEPSDAPQG